MNVKAYISDFIAANAHPMNDVDFEFDMSDVGIESFVYSYNSVDHIELEGDPILHSYKGGDLDDYVTMPRCLLSDMIDGLPDDKPAVMDASQRSALIQHMTDAMHHPLVESITMYTDNGVLKTMDHSEYVASVVKSIIDFIDNA